MKKKLKKHADGRNYEKLEIQPVYKDRMKIEIIGETSLIAHRFCAKVKDQMAAAQERKSKKATPRPPKNPEEEFNNASYKLEDGRWGFPCTAFKAAIVRASKNVQGLTMTDTRQQLWVIPDGISVDKSAGPNSRFVTKDECVAIIAADPVCREDAVKVSNGGTDLRYRPEFQPWSATLTIDYDQELLKPTDVAELVYRAGTTVGVGEKRLEKGHTNGSWTIKSVLYSRGET